MNITLSPIKFQANYIYNKNSKPKTKSKKETTCSASFEQIESLKNQVLFEPSSERLRKLNFLQEKLSLNFKNTALLNHIFTLKNQEKSQLNQSLEKMGEKVIYQCIEKGYKMHHPNTPQHQIKERLSSLTSDENLAHIAKHMGLHKYIQGGFENLNEAQYAYLLKSLIGAIYIDSKEDGFEEVFKFIDKNLRAEFFGAENTKVKNQNSAAKSYISHSLSRREAIFNTIKDYNLEISPETLSFAFSRDSLDTERFDRYKNIGKLAYAVYVRKNLYEEYPYKNALQATKIEQDGRTNQIAKTVRAMFDKKLYKDNSPEKLPLTGYFYALLGAIIEEGGENSHKNLEEFLNKYAKDILNEYAPYQAENEYEALNKEFIKLGINPDDIFVETKFYDNKCENKVFYQSRFLTKINTPIKNGMRFGQETALREAIIAIKKGGIGKIKNNPKENIDDYRQIDKFRKVKLENFAKQYGLNFSDYSLLNRVFLFGKTAKRTQIQYHDSYENIEYIGDAVLEYCVHKILIENKEGYDYQDITHKLHSFTRNSNLAKIGKRMKFDKYVLGSKQIEIKRYADMFEALIAAIYLDGGKDGLDRAYRFINNNFRDEILNMSGEYESNY